MDSYAKLKLLYPQATLLREKDKDGKVISIYDTPKRRKLLGEGANYGEASSNALSAIKDKGFGSLIKKLQGCDSDWFWIPKGMINQFVSHCEKMHKTDCEKEPMLFDYFEKRFGHFRTGGDPHLTPEIFK